MPSRNELTIITLYPFNDKTRVQFYGVRFGYSGDPVLLSEQPRTLLVKALPTRDWSGLGTTSYYSPSLMVLLRVPNTRVPIEAKVSWQEGRSEEHVVVMCDVKYTRETRKEVYQRAQKIIDQCEAMSIQEVAEVVCSSHSHSGIATPEVDCNAERTEIKAPTA